MVKLSPRTLAQSAKGAKSTLAAASQQFPQDPFAQTDIVDDELCDNIVTRLGPSLEKYKGCDILDASPGLGIWSSKIHELLKPRRHVLIHSKEEYDPFLKPLIDAPGSRYVHAPFDGFHYKSFAKAIAQGYLPDQQPLEPQDPRINEPNTSLLVLANFTRKHPRMTEQLGRYKRFALNALSSAAWSHNLFHKYGLVRMLIWVDDEFKNNVVPKSIATDSFIASFNRVSNSHIVVECPQEDRWLRESDLGLASAVETARRMQQNGVEPLLPTRPDASQKKVIRFRERALQLGANIHSNPAIKRLELDLLDPKDQFRWDQFLEEELNDLKGAFESGELSRYSNDGVAQSRRIEPRFIRLLYLRTQKSTYKKPKIRKATDLGPTAYLNFRRKIFELELKIAAGMMPEEKQLAAVAAHAQLTEQLQAAEARASVTNRSRVYFKADNRRALYQNPPLLMWDRRQYEPLLARRGDFSPKGLAALLDIQPKPAPRPYTDADMLYWRRFFERIFVRSAPSLEDNLEQSIGKGCADVVLQQARILKDPSRGGSYNPHLLTARTITPEGLDEIIDAYRGWLFRPDSVEQDLTKVSFEWDFLEF